jgi:hypothetical protein
MSSPGSIGAWRGRHGKRLGSHRAHASAPSALSAANARASALPARPVAILLICLTSISCGTSAGAPDETDPAALMAHHWQLEAKYFDPDLQGSRELQRLTQDDPVRVIDVRSRRLMTERDVMALAQIRQFARSDGPPVSQELSREKIDELAALLNAAFGGNSGRMPLFYGETAVFWAGLQDAWADLSPEQQALARAYANKTWRVQMPVEMYGKLWGLDAQNASNRHAADVSARISQITQLNIALGNLPFMIDAIFGR